MRLSQSANSEEGKKSSWVAVDLKINHLASLSFFRTFDSSLAARHWSNIHKTFKRHLSTFLQDMQNLIKAPISSQGEISSSCLLFRSSTEQAQHTHSNAPKRPVERNTLLLSDLFEKKGRREKNQISYINKFGTESTCPTFGLIEKKTSCQGLRESFITWII